MNSLSARGCFLLKKENKLCFTDRVNSRNYSCFEKLKFYSSFQNDIWCTFSGDLMFMITTHLNHIHDSEFDRLFDSLLSSREIYFPQSAIFKRSRHQTI